MPLVSSFTVNILATLTKAFDLLTASQPLNKPYTVNLATGTGANQADKLFHDTRTTAATDSLDLNAGGLLDIYGDVFTIARIKGLLVAPAGANGADIRVTRPAANGIPIFGAAADFIVVRPGGCLLWVAPDATGVVVTAGTGDLLDIVSAAGSLTYDIVIIGASA